MSLVRAPLTDTDSESDRERDEPSNNNNDRNVNNSNSHVPISPVAIVQASNARKRAREKSQAERERKRRKKDEAKIDKNKAKINKKSRKRKAKSNIKKVATASTTSSDSKIEKRINENPDHSLCNLDNTLYCQACCQSISTHKGNCDSHLLCDHHNRVALPNWKARRSGKTQSSISSIQRRKETLKDIGTDSVVAACISGIGGSEICKYNQLMHNKYRFRNGRGLVTDPSSFSGKLQQARERVDEVITKWIDREKPFNIIVDECDDESKPGGMLHIMYNANNDEKSVLLQAVYIDDSLNQHDLVQLVDSSIKKHQFKNRKLSGLYGDSTAYVVAAIRKLQNLYVFAVHFPDCSHLLVLPIKELFDADIPDLVAIDDVVFIENVDAQELNRLAAARAEHLNDDEYEDEEENDDEDQPQEEDNFFKELKMLFTACHAYFKNSKERKHDFARFIKAYNKDLTKKDIFERLSSCYCAPDHLFVVDDDQVPNDESSSQNPPQSVSRSLDNDLDLSAPDPVPEPAVSLESDDDDLDIALDDDDLESGNENEDDDLKVAEQAQEPWHVVQLWKFNCVPPKVVLSRWECVYSISGYYLINLMPILEYFGTRLPVEHFINTRDSDVINLKLVILIQVIHPTFKEVQWFQGYGEGCTQIFERLVNVTQHYRKKPAIQKALSKDYERYLRNTRDIVDKPKYLKHWWKSNEREYKYLSVIALRCLNALRGGCAVERSFNHFSKMNRSGNAATMGPLNKEVRTMCHWNKELIANGLFDLTSL
eukprot:304001_1